jgi:hypothetical protein
MEEPTSVPVQRTGPASLLRIGLVGAAAAAMVAVGILAAATSASPSGIFAADPTASASSGSGAATVPGDHPGGPGGWAMGGRGMRGGGMHAADITITAISGNSIILKTADGWSRTITVDSGTTYQKNGATASLSDLKVGDEIQFKETHEANGTYTIDAIVVIPPHAGGTVSAISGSTITVTLPDGTSTTIKVGSTTTYDVAGNGSATLADIKTGMVVQATGTRNSDGSLSATTVRAFDPATMQGPGNGDHDGGRGFGHGMPGMHANPNASAAPSTSSGTTSG